MRSRQKSAVEHDIFLVVAGENLDIAPVADVVSHLLLISARPQRDHHRADTSAGISGAPRRRLVHSVQQDCFAGRECVERLGVRDGDIQDAVARHIDLAGRNADDGVVVVSETDLVADRKPQ